MSQIDVKDASGVTQTIAAVDNTGQVAAADSLPVVIASDQSAVPVSAAALPLPSGAATAAKQPALGTAGTASADVITVQGVASMTPVLTDGSATTQPISATSLPLPTGAASESTLAAQGTLIGAVNETAPASDTASSGLNGRLQRIAQRITSLIALLPASLGPKSGASSLSVVEATPTTVTIVSLQTNATGATYNAFASQACEQLDIVNTAPTAVDLEVRRGGSGNTIIVPAGSSRMFVGLSNASDLQVRRLDQSNTQVTFTAEAIKA